MTYTPTVIDLPEFKISSITFIQEEDCCGDPDNMDQFCTVEFLDGGGGYYSVITTERWAMDKNEWLPFQDCIDAIIHHNNVLDGIEDEDIETVDDEIEQRNEIEPGLAEEIESIEDPFEIDYTEDDV